MIRHLLCVCGFILMAAACSRKKHEPGNKVVLIVVDALRADYLGCYGDTRPISPQIDRFAKSATLFERFYSASSWTAPAFGTLFTGVSPEVHRAGKKPDKDSSSQKSVYGRQLEPMRAGVPTLAEALGKIPSHAILNNSFLSKELGYHRGFDGYDLFLSKNTKLRPARLVTQLAIKWLKTQTQSSYFLVVHYFDPHLEYNPPPHFNRRFSTLKVGRIGASFGDIDGIKSGRFVPTPKEKEQIKALYSDEIAYADEEVGRLLHYLDENGIGDDAWVVFTADHGEELFDHGDFEHGHRFEDEVTRVPLIIRPPKALRSKYPRRRVAETVRQVDIHPTVLAAFGLKPIQKVEGESVLPFMVSKGKPRTAFMQYVFRGRDAEALVTGGDKYIRYLSGGDKVYDLKRDALEKHPLSDQKRGKKLGDFLNQYKARLKTEFNSGKAHQAVTLPPEVDEALKNLGYIEE